MKRFLAGLAIAGLMVASADASILGSFIRSGSAPGVLNALNDNNAEYIVKGAGNTAAAFEVGDSVELYLSFDNITTGDGFFNGTDLDLPQTGGAGYHLLAQGTFTITSIVPTGVNRGNISFSGSLDLFESGTNFDFTQGITAANTVVGGATQIATIGTAPLSDDFIISENARLLFSAIVGNPPNPGPTTTTQFGLSLLSGGEDLFVAPDALENANAEGTFHDFVGTTTAARFRAAIVLGDDEFDLQTNTEVSFLSLSQVPEPATVIIWASLATIVGSVAYGRRQNAGC